MPESFGKRQRNTARARKVAAREERRLERKQRDADRAAGLIEPGTPIAENEDEDVLGVRPSAPGTAPDTDTETATETDADADSDTKDETASDDST